MKAYISDIDAIANAFDLTDKKFHLFGHSWGGLYAQIYAQENMDRLASLFLCSPSSGTAAHWKETEKEVLQFSKGVASGVEWMKMGLNSLKGMLGSDKAYRKLFLQVMKNYHQTYTVEEPQMSDFEKINAKPINHTRKEIIKYPVLEKVQSAEFPILVSYGENDIYGESKRYVVERYPSAKFITIPNSGHIPWKHNVAAFEEWLNRFYHLS